MKAYYNCALAKMLTPRSTCSLLVIIVLIPMYASASPSSLGTSSEGLAIVNLDVYLSEEHGPKGNVHCGTYVCNFGDKFDVYARVENTSNETRTYTLVTEVRDASDHTTEFLATESAAIPPNQGMSFYIPWIPEEGGDYQVRAFLISNLESPQILSAVNISEVTIVDTSFKGLVKMVKEGCAFVPCPAYQNRTAIFEGNDQVSKPRRHVFEITNEQRNQLIEAFQKADFLSMNYSQIAMTDAAGFEITFNMDENRNSIHYYPFDAPEELLKLEKRIHEILGINRWVEGD